MDKYENMSRAQLAALCRKHNLSDEGSVATLRKRIRKARDEAKARKTAAPEPETPTPTAQEAEKDLPPASADPEEDGPENAGNDHEGGPDGDGYEVELTFGSDTYFSDQAWDDANCKLASMRAEAAGHRVVGNARRSRVNGNTITYTVPVG